MQSITEEAQGRDIWFTDVVRQIGVPVMMSVGWQPKTVHQRSDWIRVKVSRKYWLTIKLSAEDTYDVEVGSIRKKNGLPEYKVLDQAHGIYAEQLSKTVLKMGDRA